MENKSIGRKEPVVPSANSQGVVHNQKSMFPYAASVISRAKQNLELSIFERHCIGHPSLFSDVFFKAYDLKTILSFRLISKTVCEFINLGSFFGMSTSISFWYKQLLIPISESIRQDQQRPVLEIKNPEEANRFLKLLQSGQYDKNLIDGIETINSKFTYNNISILNEILNAICQNLPISLKNICVGRICKLPDSSSFIFTPPSILLKKITSFSILSNHDVTVDLEEATGLEILNIEFVGGEFILPKVMNKLETICIKKVGADLALPTQAENLLNLHIEGVYNTKLLLPNSLDKLENLHIEDLGGEGVNKLPKSFPNLISLHIGKVWDIDLSGLFPKLTTLHVELMQTLKLSDSYPSLANLSIDTIFHETHFKLTRVDKLLRLSIGSVLMNGSFQVAGELNNLEILIIGKVLKDNIKLPVMPNLKKFIIEDMYRYAKFEFPGNIDTLKALDDTNVLDNKKFELKDSGKNTTHILWKNR